MIRTLINRKLVTAERELGESHEYMRHILRTSLKAFLRFARIFAISDYRGGLPADAYHVARIVASRFLPVVKRTLGYATSCSLVSIHVDDQSAKQ